MPAAAVTPALVVYVIVVVVKTRLVEVSDLDCTGWVR